MPASFPSDDVYISGIQRGDESIFTEFVDVYIDSLTRFAFGLTGVEDAAHDIVQDVFARIWQLGVDWHPTHGVAPYLFTAVRHRTYDWIKANQAALRLRESLRSQMETEVPDDPYVDIAMVNVVRQEFMHLTERQRTALQLRYDQELPMPQVALILGIALRPAEKLVARALATLRERLRKVQDELG